MPLNFEDIDFLVGDLRYLEEMRRKKVVSMYAQIRIDFLAALSKQLLKDERSKSYPDVMAYAFWIRRGSLEKNKEHYPQCSKKMGRGVSFHIAPSNVPINFIVSMTSALLAGNACIVRVSQKAFEQVDIICDAINAILNTAFESMKPYICIMRYAHNESMTAYLSSLCDIRIIWGGDETIHKIQQAPLPARAIELTFADRYSLAMINADHYLRCNPKEIAEKFYIDTYYMDQNACSSPRMVIWLGDKIEEARKQFWQVLDEKVKREYELQPIQVVNKWQAFSELAMKHEKIQLISENNGVMRVEVHELFKELMNYKASSGYFFEYCATAIDEVSQLFDKPCQTIAYLGIEPMDIYSVIVEKGVYGVDRIVPLGETMQLSFIWDGYDMIDAMSRYINIV